MKQRAPNLRARQEDFVAAVRSGLSPEKAALQAGYAPATARRTGHRLMQSPAIRSALAESGVEAAPPEHGTPDVSPEQVIQELAAIGFGVLSDVCSWSAEGIRLHDSTRLTRAQASMIAEIREASSGKGGVHVKLHSKLKALEMLGRHFGMFGGAANEGGATVPMIPEELRQRIDSMYAGYGSEDAGHFGTSDEETDTGESLADRGVYGALP